MNATPDNPLTEPDQRIADLERQLAECQAERDEALAQQTASTEVLQVINSSPGDLTPVFDAILEKAHRLCGGVFGRLLVRDGDEFHLVAAHGEAQWVEAVRQLGPWRPPEGTPLARLVGGERIVHVPDVREEDRYRNTPSYKRLLDAAGTRTMLMVPLRKDEALLGAITASRPEIRPFSEKQIALLQNFAAQAVIAIENARLLNETREALEQQMATGEVLQVINASPADLAPVFDAMLEKAMRLCGAAYGVLRSFDGERAHLLASRGVPSEYASFLTRRTAEQYTPGVWAAVGTDIMRALQTAQPTQTMDVRESVGYRSGAPGGRAIADLGGARTVLHVPLIKDQVSLGLFTLYRQEVRLFSDKQIVLLQNFAAQAVIAMENARLLIETHEALEQQTATAEVLQVINSSPGDLAPVFEAMLEKATRLCEAPFGNLRTWDGEQFNFGAVYGDPEFCDWVRRHGPWVPTRDDDSPLSRIRKGERVVRFTVATGDEDQWSSAGFTEMIEITGMRSGILVALKKDEALLGTISVYRQGVRPFSDKQIGLLQSFAAQAVIAIENARLLGELHQRTEEVAELNRGLEAQVAEQVEELGRVGRLKRFLAPQLAELIVSQGNEQILESHRREIVVVFCDVRGYTAFTETAEPEEVLDFLREYHGTLGPLVAQFEGTLDQFSGDGIMVFFNDPVPIPDPAARAVSMAVAMREAAGTLIAKWRRRGRELGFGAGIAQGYATLGQIGFAERSGYTAIGTVCNLAARLCTEAKDGQILLAQRLAVSVEEIAVLEEIGPLSLKGLTQPVVAYNIPLATIQPARSGIEGVH